MRYTNRRLLYALLYCSCSGSRYLLKFREISDNISETVQDISIVVMEVY